MKLNTEIIFDNLTEFFPAELKGLREKSLHLGRPEYYLGAEQAFRSGRLYVVKGERLPNRPGIEKGAAVVCVGGSLHLPYYLERCGVIQISPKTEWPLIFNVLTEIYDKYDAWNEKLNTILNTSADVNEMVACSVDVFGNPVFVLNANFHYLAHSGYSDVVPAQWETALEGRGGDSELALPKLGKFLERHELSTETREPILINILDSSTLNVNLFEDGEYSGCMTIDYRFRKRRAGDDPLAQHLARMIELALKKYTASVMNEKSTLRQILHDVIDGYQIDPDQRWVLSATSGTRAYICVKTKFSSRLAQLPVGYMCDMLEKTFPKSVAFEYDGAIVGFIETQALGGENGSCHQAFREQIMPLVSSMNFDIGVGDPFDDIHSAQMYYMQACSALENGRLFAPPKHFHLFQDYALTELIVNALGKLPVEMYYTDGLRKLAKHDASSPVSYIETLRAYLDNSMSITKTTASLYINRSTLIERISRIKRDLGTDLHDPDERLRLQILLKAMQIQSQMQIKPE